MRIKILSIGFIVSLLFSLAVQADVCPSPEVIQAVYTAPGGWIYELNEEPITDNTLDELKHNIFQLDRVELLTQFKKQPPLKCIYKSNSNSNIPFFIYLRNQQKLVAYIPEGKHWVKKNAFQYTCKRTNVADCPFTFYLTKNE